MRLFIAALLLLIGVNHACAWGEKGHEVIAQVAWHYISPEARHQIELLLKNDSSGLTATDFASEASWADAYRDSDRNTTKVRYEQTRRWHYINLALGSINPALDNPSVSRACYGSPPLQPKQHAADGPAKACIVDKIDQFIAELKSPKASTEQRLRALQFLIHLVGDLHQPLHASDNDDNGGNEVRVSAKGYKRGTLHGYWDSAAVSQLGRKTETIARKLITQTGQAQLEIWRQGKARDWAFETFGVARNSVYRELPVADENGVHTLDDEYVETAKIITSQQLMKAGVRLAWLLEPSFPMP